MSHRSTIYNDTAEEIFLETFGQTFNETINANHAARGFENASGKQVFGSGGFWRALETGYFFTGIPMDALADGFQEVLENWRESGMTSFGSRLGTPFWVSGFHYLLRREGRLPIRFGYSLEIHRGIIPPEVVTRLYGLFGTQWDDMNSSSSDYLWQHGVSSEGAWDSVQRACLGPDLDAVSEEAKSAEACPPLYENQQIVLREALENLYRLVGVHMVGSHGGRLWVQMVQDAIENSNQLTKEKVREMRLGGAHGTAVGKVPDVMNLWKEYNIHVPVNVPRALDDEPQTLLDRYGEEGLQFLAPAKTLLDNDVKVVGESENTDPSPEWYFEVLNAYVNRFTVSEEGEDTDVWVPEEGIDRVRALKLITYRSAEFLHAETEVGSIEPGKLADFVVMQNDLLEAAQENIRDNTVIAVGVDGDIKHQSSEAENFMSVGTGQEAFQSLRESASG